MAKQTKTQTQTKTEVVAPAVAATKVMPSVESLIKQGFTTKSAQIRHLDSEGFTRSEIKNHLGIIYQHVRNVLTRPLKKAGTAEQAVAAAPVVAIPAASSKTKAVTSKSGRSQKKAA